MTDARHFEIPPDGFTLITLRGAIDAAWRDDLLYAYNAGEFDVAILNGGAGADELLTCNGAANDVLTGGTGADFFRRENGDDITDFDSFTDDPIESCS